MKIFEPPGSSANAERWITCRADRRVERDFISVKEHWMLAIHLPVFVHSSILISLLAIVSAASVGMVYLILAVTRQDPTPQEVEDKPVVHQVI